MPELPVQLVILKRLTKHLAGMTVDGGYGYDMTGKVYRGRTTFGAETTLPAIAILEAPEPAVGNPAGDANLVRNTPWQLIVQGFVPDDKDNPTDPAHMLKAYVTRRLAEIVATGGNGRPVNPDIYRLGGLISDLVIGNGVVRPPTKDVSDKAFFVLPVSVSYASRARSPLMEVTDVDNP